MVDLNITLAIQLVNFIIALVVLNYVLVKPIRTILQKRRAVVNSLVNETEKQKTEAGMRIQRYEADIDAARVSAAEQRDIIKAQGADSEHSILAYAQAEAQSFLQKSRKDVEQEVAAAMKDLRGQVNVLAGKVVDKVLE